MTGAAPGDPHQEPTVHGFASSTRSARSLRIRRLDGADQPRAVRYRAVADPRPIGLNVVPLVDVTFLLMIFFVIAGSFDTWEGVLRSKMPRVVGGGGAAASAALPVTPVTVRISRSGLGDDDVAIDIEDFPPSPRSFLQLTDSLARIRRLPGFDGDTLVILMADDDVRWQHVVNGWNAAVRAGFQNLAYGEPVRPRP